MSMFNVVRKTDAAYANVAKQVEELATQGNRFPYAELTRNYNALGQDEILSFPFPKEKASVIVNQLEKRGLIRDTDYTLVNAEVDGQNQAVLTRRSDKEGVPSPTRTRRPLTEEEKAARAKARAARKAEAEAEAGNAGSGKGKRKAA